MASLIRNASVIYAWTCPLPVDRYYPRLLPAVDVHFFSSSTSFHFSVKHHIGKERNEAHSTIRDNFVRYAWRKRRVFRAENGWLCFQFFWIDFRCLLKHHFNQMKSIGSVIRILLKQKKQFKPYPFPPPPSSYPILQLAQVLLSHNCSSLPI